VTPHDWGRVSPFGHPRITARLTAPRGLSQPPTSFIGSWCQGIHRAPLITWPQRCSRPLCNSQTTNGHQPTPHHPPRPHKPAPATHTRPPATETRQFGRQTSPHQPEDTPPNPQARVSSGPNSVLTNDPHTHPSPCRRRGGVGPTPKGWPRSTPHTRGSTGGRPPGPAIVLLVNVPPMSGHRDTTGPAVASAPARDHPTMGDRDR
jgi:hypothetical protein